jgi:hypothetical protein
MLVNPAHMLLPRIGRCAGVGGSQMVGSYTGDQRCAPMNDTVVWYADRWAFTRHLSCWAHLMSLRFDAASGRWLNSTGTSLWPDYGSVFGAFPQDSKQRLFYALFEAHMFKSHGYIPGRDLFIIPFDWRIGLQGLEQTGGLQRLTQDISRAVAHNCGQKAIVLSHSYGASVMAGIFQAPQYEQWRCGCRRLVLRGA